jgi:glutathione S-transferase
MLVLYDYLPSQNAWKVRQLLHHLRRPFQTRLVRIFDGEGRTEAFRAISPTGTVPALVLEDGRALAESNAILTYLAEGTAYLPTDAYGRARVMQWLSFEQERVESQIGALRHWTLTGKLTRRPEALVAMKRRAGLNALSILDAQFATRDWIAADRYTIADLSLYAYAGVADEAGFDLESYANLRAWFERVRAQERHLAERFDYSVDPHSGNEL